MKGVLRMGLREELLAQGCVEKTLSKKGRRKELKYLENKKGDVEAKICTTCSLYKYVSDFSKDASKTFGLHSQCIKCRKTVRNDVGRERKSRIQAVEKGGIEYRNCSKCKELKPFREYHKDKNSPFGVKSYCKDCASKGKGIYKKYELVEEGGLLYKDCGYCGKLKPLDSFYEHKYKLGGRDTICKQCNSIKSSEYRREHRDQEIERSRVWYQKNKDRQREYTKKYNIKNKQMVTERKRRYRRLNSDQIKEYNRKWRSENPYKAKLQSMKRRARENALPDYLNYTEQQKILAKFNNGCALTDSLDYHFDHVIPVSIGHGGTVFENIIPLRSDLNISKNSSNIFEWFRNVKTFYNLEQARFDALIEYLADINDMTVDEYRRFVYWCHENPREINELEELS
jgi:hypothetical protein